MGPELVLDARAELGEAPVWDPATGGLIWVDITQGLVHRTEPTTAADRTWAVGMPTGVAVPCRSGRIAVAAATGFWFLDPESGEVQHVATVEDPDGGTTMNDGSTDPAGRFWAGTKDMQGRGPVGALYRWTDGSDPVRVVEGLTVSNGLAWSPDGATMYLIDSPTYRIDAFDHDPASGHLAHRRRLVDLPRDGGMPDGMCVDADGCLWVAFWGGGAVRRFTPRGVVDTVVRMPATLVTSCSFGGPDLGDLYVTTAREGLTPGELASQPHAGGLFRLRPGVAGLAQVPFADRG
jgi:sugar lactone lactonase YvrE